MKFLPISEPNIDKSELENVIDAVKSTWISSIGKYINDFENNIFKDRIDLLDRFHELLVSCGYSKIHSKDYKNLKYDIYDGKFYLVNNDFPRLTTDNLKEPLDKRISDLRYIINLNGVSADSFEDMPFGKFLQ